MTKIKVQAEGRPNIWLPDRETLKQFIAEKNFTTVHNYLPAGSMMLGADHDIDSVMADIDAAERLAIFTDSANLGHALALVLENKLSCFDIGKITEDDLEINV
jgi:hypothetical protein